MKEERVYHVEKDKEMLVNKKHYKEEYTKLDSTNQSDIELLNKDLDQILKELEKTLSSERE